MPRNEGIAYAQSAAIEALNGLTELLAHVEQMGRDEWKPMLFRAIEDVRQMNAILGEEMELP